MTPFFQYFAVSMAFCVASLALNWPKAGATAAIVVAGIFLVVSFGEDTDRKE